MTDTYRPTSPARLPIPGIPAVGEERAGGSWRSRRCVALYAAMLLFLAALGGAPALAASAAPQVLMILSHERQRPAGVEMERGFRQSLGDATGRSIQVNVENLDAPAFSGAVHEANFARYITGKYGDRGIDVIVVFSTEAMRFLLNHDLGPLAGVPVVHSFVESGVLRAFGPLPPRFVGQPMDLDVGNTIELALRLHPKATRLWVVTGNRSVMDRRYDEVVHPQAARFAGRVTVEYLRGLPTAELHARLRTAGPDTVVVTTGYEVDSNGVVGTQRASVAAMAAVSTAPLYAPTYLGTGIVGGYALDFESIGRVAGRTAARLIDGATPDSLASAIDYAPMFMLQLDWRQVQRWNIDLRAIPPGARFLFRQPTFLEANRDKVIVAITIFLLQAGLIAWLLFERRRRHSVEIDLQRQRHELAHATRMAVSAELTGAIAHEINQPLGAILSNADAAALGIKNGRASPELLREIMGDIHRDVMRASDVIRGLRSMFFGREVRSERFDVRALLTDIDSFLQIEARRRRMTIELLPGADSVMVFGRRIEIQQVIVNLILNAMDAMEGMPEDRRRVTLGAEVDDSTVVLEVRDQGAGISPEHFAHLFESFFTTKPNGMGLGLSISRTLVQAHGGRISAANAPRGGAVFRVELPLSDGIATPPAPSA